MKKAKRWNLKKLSKCNDKVIRAVAALATLCETYLQTIERLETENADLRKSLK